MKRFLGIVLSVLLVAGVITMTSCQESAKKKVATAAEIVGINIEPLKDDGSGAVMPLGDALGPNGETPVGVDAILNLITPEQKEEIKAAGYKAALCLHSTIDDWSILQIQGIEAVCDEFGIELIAITDAEFTVEKQVSDFETLIAMEPDLIISFVLDAYALAPLIKDASSNGIKVSLIDAVPAGCSSPEDYAGMGTADNFANGVASAEVLVEYLEGKGEIGMLPWETSLFHCDARYQGAMSVFNKYPGIKVVDEQGINSPETAATAAEGMLIAHPGIKGFWCVWDGGAMGAVGVIENMGFDDIKVVAVDLSESSAYSIASGGALLGVGAQHPYDQGVAEAMIGVAALAGIETPSYVIVPGEKVTKASMEESWMRVFKTELPADIKALLN